MPGPGFTRRLHLVRTLAPLAIGALAACTTDVAPVAVATVQFDIPSDSQLVGRTYQLRVTVKDVNGIELTGRTVKYESLVPEVAESDASGLVTMKRAGAASFRATVDGRSAQAFIKSLDPVVNIVITPINDQVPIGLTRQFVATATAASGASIGGRFIGWRSLNTAVATITAQGLVSALAEGTAVIEAQAEFDNVRGTTTITVIKVPVTNISITPVGTQIMRIGAFLQATATPRDANNTPLTGRTITWSSSNPTIVSVSQSGLLSAVAIGSATITAESEGRTASIGVQVTPVPIGSVTLVPSVDTLITGDQKQYNPVVTDSAGRPVTSLIGRSVTWNSNNVPVASVNSQGIVAASGSQTGTAVINVTIDGVPSNDLSVRVSQVAIIEVVPSPVTVQAGLTQPLSITLKDAQGNVLTTSRTISYLVPAANPAIISVSPAGVVTGVTAGTTQITVTVSGVTGVSAIVPVTVTS